MTRTGDLVAAHSRAVKRAQDAERRLRAVVSNRWSVEYEAGEYTITTQERMPVGVGKTMEDAIDDAITCRRMKLMATCCIVCNHLHAAGIVCNAPTIPPCKCEVGK